MNKKVKQLSAFGLFLLSVPAPLGSQKAEVSRKLEFENELVRVERIVIPARDSSPMHDHRFPSVEVFLTDDHIRETLANGTQQEWRAKAGQVAWTGTAPHRVENLRNAATEIIVVQLKSLPAAALKLASQEAAGEFENDWVRVTRTRLGARAVGPEHTHPPYVGVFLTDASLRVHLPDGKSRDASGKRGDVAWRGPATHKVENLSDKPFEAVDVNLKSSADKP